MKKNVRFIYFMRVFWRLCGEGLEVGFRYYYYLGKSN